MGLIHIYCGDGKGKTSAALGLALRTAGAGMRVHIVQLLKGGYTSELESIKLIPNISVARVTRDFGFISSMSESDRKEITMCHNELLKAAYENMLNNNIDVLIIDEFFAAYNNNLIDRELAEMIVFEKKRRCELVLTGRNPDKKFIDVADYVSNIEAIKHPYDKGIIARKGIEF